MIFPPPAGMSLTKLSLEKLVNDTLIGNGKIDYLFIQCGPISMAAEGEKEVIAFSFCTLILVNIGTEY
jgi:hypothetical protein